MTSTDSTDSTGSTGSTGSSAGSLAITRIGTLVTNDPSLGAGPLGVLTDAALVIDGGRVAWAGTTSKAPATDSHLDAAGRAVIPGFVDSHTHLLFDGDRAGEFAARMAGRPYTAGGIYATVAATRQASDARLAGRLTALLREALAQGTTTVETKSGYGLTVADEARALRVARQHTEETTFLGAHVPAPGTTPEEYVETVTGPMLDACAPHARWIDAFCERGAFGPGQARAVLAAGAARGLVPRLHASQLGPGPGVRLAVELGAASVDHCTYLTDEDVDALAQARGRTVATLLPGCEFSTRSPYADARRLLDAGATVALATDCNPGSSFTSSMPFCLALAVREMGMTPDEALWAATAGGAAALRRRDVGRLAPGCRADLVLLDAPSHVHLAYRPGVPLVRQVFRGGLPVVSGA